MSKTEIETQRRRRNDRKRFFLELLNRSTISESRLVLKHKSEEVYGRPNQSDYYLKNLNLNRTEEITSSSELFTSNLA